MRHRKSKEECIDNTMHSLRRILGVGPKLAKQLSDIGIKSIVDLKGKNPEELYSEICAK
jgi:predicted flap endonuclease-1-like 5' DNA nuclease